MGELIRMAALLIIAATFILLIKSERPEMGMLITAAVSAVVLLMCFEKINPAVENLRRLFERSGISTEYFAIVLKTLGIAYITGFVADACRDFGMSSLAAKAEFAGRCIILLLSLPLLSQILNTALEFAGI